MGIKNNTSEHSESPKPNNFNKIAINTFVLEQMKVTGITEKNINSISPFPPKNSFSFLDKFEIIDANLDVNRLSGFLRSEYNFSDNNFRFNIQQDRDDLNLTCDCTNRTNKICLHLAHVLNELINNKLLQIPFNANERNRLLSKKASELGWIITNDLDELF